MWELRSLSNDSFDRRLSREEKTDEAKKTLKRLDVRVLRIETAYAEVCLLACVTRRNRKRWKRSGFCTLQQTRPRDRLKPDSARHQQNHSSNQRPAAISGSGNPACASGRRTRAGHYDRLVSCMTMRRDESKVANRQSHKKYTGRRRSYWPTKVV
jgi:hypothetical protein